jgi:hypothetical protein
MHGRKKNIKFKRSVKWLKDDNNNNRVSSHTRTLCLSTVTALLKKYLLLIESKSPTLSIRSNEHYRIYATLRHYIPYRCIILSFCVRVTRV